MKWFIGILVTIAISAFGFLYSWADEQHKLTTKKIEKERQYEQIDLYDLLSRPEDEQKIIIEHRVRSLNKQIGIKVQE